LSSNSRIRLKTIARRKWAEQHSFARAPPHVRRQGKYQYISVAYVNTPALDPTPSLHRFGNGKMPRARIATTGDKTLLYKAEAVEIRDPLD
jgi:hypothetical protein